MALELVRQGVLAACLLIQVDNVLLCNGEELLVCGEGMVGDGPVEEVVDFGGGHFGKLELR